MPCASRHTHNFAIFFLINSVFEVYSGYLPEGTSLILTNMILGQMSSPFNIYPMTAIKYGTLSYEVLVLRNEERKRREEGERRR